MATTKKIKVVGMMPVKTWLSLPEAMAFLDMGQTSFLKVATDNGLTVAAIGAKKYYRVDQLQNLIEQNILIA